MKAPDILSKGLAGAPGLSFVNAMAPAPHQKRAALRTGTDLLVWLEEHKLISSQEHRRLLAETEVADLDAVAADALELGRWFRSFLDGALGQPLTRAQLVELEPLNRILSGGGHFRVVERAVFPEHSGPALSLAPRRRWSGATTALQPIAESMASLLCDRDFPFIRQCDGADCGLLFIDRTRARARRWCSMAKCGNRAKQVAHRSVANENG